ncbi:MAG: pyruvate formate lyase family protein, partial [Lachnospiraceae bacterium]|nr:pyruvate formate lyase family protein [Lachnospiraceae bacterium]
MDFHAFREELTGFYREKADDLSKAFCERIYKILDSKDVSGMDGYQRKALQYETIAAEAKPILFHSSPFYHELGTIAAISDGAGEFRGFKHAGNWNYERSHHLFIDQDPALYDLLRRQRRNILYLTGSYGDYRQHFIFNCKPLMKGGLKSLYEKALQEYDRSSDPEERSFLQAAMTGLRCLKTISLKFASLAEERLKTVSDPEERKNLKRIRDAAAHTPWNRPRTFYEALNLLAFCRTVTASLEGVGYNTFGRPDVELLPFYEADLRSGVLTKAEAHDLVKAFLLTWDVRYDHDMKMVGYADHEFENTYTLGGCDEEGKPVFNDLTEMFLLAASEEKIIYPKIKVRFSGKSPRAYLDIADSDVIHSTSTILYQNDDATIPALVRAGRSLSDARDYIVTGCWGLTTNGNHMDDHGNYVNILRAFEMSVHDMKDKMEECGLQFIPLDEAESFEDVYRITVENCRILAKERNRMTLLGKGMWHKADPLPLTSASMDDCIKNRKDLTNGGCRYHDEQYTFVGFPNIVDSLLAIRKIVFEERKVTLREYLNAVRSNFEGYEDLRSEAVKAPGWGDGSDESCELANRFNHDLYKITGELKTLWPGGRVNVGHLTYTEIRFWAEKMKSTPDGRRDGEYFSQGLTPSRLKKISSVFDVIHSLSRLDPTEIGANSVVNIILPSIRMTLDNCAAFLYASADSALQSLQLNCVTKE